MSPGFHQLSITSKLKLCRILFFGGNTLSSVCKWLCYVERICCYFDTVTFLKEETNKYKFALSLLHYQLCTFGLSNTLIISLIKHFLIWPFMPSQDSC